MATSAHNADDVRSARRLRLEQLVEIVHEEIYGMPVEQGTHDTGIHAAVEAMDRLVAEEAALNDGTLRSNETGGSVEA